MKAIQKEKQHNTGKKENNDQEFSRKFQMEFDEMKVMTEQNEKEKKTKEA